MNTSNITIYLPIILSFLLSCMSPNYESYPIEEITIAELHQDLKEGKCTCESIVKQYISRMEQLDSAINSIVMVNPNAISMAKEMDRQLKNLKTLPPMYCVPVIVKDNYHTKGLQTTAGSIAFSGFEPSENAYQVQKLIDAGAIVLAKSNMAEWAFSPRVTISSIAGETRNPYNTSHVPAGSSGGTGAAVAMNFGTVGLGTDTGNSIRGPSSHNALVGIRSTLGLTSRSGIIPLYYRNDVGGPMCRTVEDAVRVLDVIAGYDPDDPVTHHSINHIPDSFLDYLKKDGLKGKRIGILRILSDDDPNPEVAQLFKNAIKDIKAQGATIINPFVVPGFDSLRQGQWCPVFKRDLHTYLNSLGQNAPIEGIDELLEKKMYSEYIRDRLTFFNEYNLDSLNRPCADPYEDPQRVAFRDAIENTMDHLEVDLLIYPTWNHPPAHIGKTNEYKGDNSQVIAPHTGQPAFTVPMGYNADGLPSGIQFLGRMYDEAKIIEAAYAYEQATLHRKPPGK